ncbi:response regulator transcription factor [Amycolatopsis acidicola]|uniref:Response regulator transcription factor n=1 Tax=Amycolatopsis acidicola TaxID=2596893 RepID=A0A5N0VNF1_9PSEU|nr:response regulator transcription factor [Amycolatopsis acidicola]KAA9166322.1 response regulator transcription factor [Amycolatopsis acidicola]
MRVLVIADEGALRSAVEDSLRGAGMDVDAVGALPDGEITGYDLVVVDELLPVRAGSIPVLLLTGRDTLTDRVALSLLRQVDDYLGKPFSTLELLTRVQILARRSGTLAAPSRRVLGDLEIDLQDREVRVRGALLTLTRKEYAVLEALAARPDQVVSPRALLEEAWGSADAPADNVVHAVVGRLRRKLGSAARLESVRGLGYRLRSPEESVRDSGIGVLTAVATFPVTIYLGDETAHREVQAAVEELIEGAGGDIVEREDPVLGSWFRRMRARAADSALAKEAATAAAHALDSRVTLAQDATVTATMMQNLGPVLGSLHSTKDAVIRVGALLIVKVEWAVAVHQLTAAQQLLLDHQPNLLTSPQDILTALRPCPDDTTVPAQALRHDPGATERETLE